MSAPTKPAFIHIGTWDESTRNNEAMAWMEKYALAVDAKAWDHEPYSNWLTSDSVLQKSTGEVVSGGEAAWSSLSKELYGPFPSHLHEPQMVVCWEIEGGWKMLGVATVYWNLAVPGQAGAKKVKDLSGKEWEGSGPGAMDFIYRKTPEGIRLARTAIYMDPSVAMVEMFKRGMMKPEDLMK